MISDRLRMYLMGHLRDSIAVLVVVTPVYAVLEVHLLAIPMLVSLRARMLTAVVIVGGLGVLIAKVRDWSHKRFGVIPGATSELFILVHDLVLLALLNGVIAPLVYLISGATFGQSMHGTLLAISVSTVTGPANGMSIDAFRELLGSRPVGRLPEWISNVNITWRVGMAGFVVVTSALIVSISYYLSP